MRYFKIKKGEKITGVLSVRAEIRDSTLKMIKFNLKVIDPPEKSGFWGNKFYFLKLWKY